MCAVSMIMERGQKELQDYWIPGPVPDTNPWIPPIIIDPEKTDGFDPDIDVKDKMTLEEWVEYFENLLKMAKEFDEKTGQPDCEDAIKKMAIDKIAKELGIEITFP